MTLLESLANALAGGSIEIVDLTHTLDPDFPVIVLPPEFGQCRALSYGRSQPLRPQGPRMEVAQHIHVGAHRNAF